MDLYAYLLLGVALLPVWICLYAVRPDLRPRMMKASLCGALIGPAAEYWYLKDYWHPPVIFSVRFVAFEDLLFGFLVAGVSVAFYDVLFRTYNTPAVRGRRARYLSYGFIVLSAAASLYVFSTVLGFNSIFVSSLWSIGTALVMVSVRHDLMFPSFMAGVLSSAIIVPIYLLLFGMLLPSYIHSYFFLGNTAYGGGPLPLTELLWYFSWGTFAGIVANAVSGSRKIPLQA